MQRRTLLLAGLSCLIASPGLGQVKPALRSGPMLGYAELTETVIWLQTTAPATVKLRYWPQGKPAEARDSESLRTQAVGDHIARFTLTGLPFGTRFDYQVWLEGKPLPLPYATTFQTQPMWRWRTDPPEFSFAFGSCNYHNEAPFDRPGKPYGSEPEIFKAIHAQKPDFMLWLGDNTYLREADWLTEAGIRARHAHTRSAPELQPLLGSVHHYATWDDHDFGPNDSDRSFRLKGESLKAFSDYFPAVRYGTPETPGCFQRFEWADCEFFLLDDRYWRAPNALLDESKPMLGAAQLQWLKDSLVSSKATFKFVVCGGQVLNDLNPFEGWNQFPGERGDFLDFIAKQKIPGLLFLSGDRHMAELIRRERGSLYPLYDFTSSALTAGVSKGAAIEENNPARVPGTWINDKHNFGRIQVRGKKGERTLTLTACDKDGKDLWSKSLTEQELR